MSYLRLFIENSGRKHSFRKCLVKEVLFGDALCIYISIRKKENLTTTRAGALRIIFSKGHPLNPTSLLSHMLLILNDLLCNNCIDKVLQ